MKTVKRGKGDLTLRPSTPPWMLNGGRVRYTWKQVAAEAQVSASTLTRMAQGRRPDVDSLAALVTWAGLSADNFVGDNRLAPEPGTLTMISTYLKSDPQLTAEAAEALDQLVKATYEHMRKKD